MLPGGVNHTGNLDLTSVDDSTQSSDLKLDDKQSQLQVGDNTVRWSVTQKVRSRVSLLFLSTTSLFCLGPELLSTIDEVPPPRCSHATPNPTPLFLSRSLDIRTTTTHHMAWNQDLAVSSDPR